MGTTTNNRSTVYAGNIPFDTTEEQLSDLFGASGRQIRRIVVVTDKDTGKPRGFAFIEFATVEEAVETVKIFNGMQFNGRTMKVSIALDRASKSKDSGKRERQIRRERNNIKCDHVVGEGLTFDTYPASYSCAKCGEYFQKPEEIAAFKKQK